MLRSFLGVIAQNAPSCQDAQGGWPDASNQRRIVEHPLRVFGLTEVLLGAPIENVHAPTASSNVAVTRVGACCTIEPSAGLAALSLACAQAAGAPASTPNATMNNVAIM